jgi:hypothetical protein
MEKSNRSSGVRFSRDGLQPIDPGFYVDAEGGRYFCPTEFLLAHNLTVDMDHVDITIDEVLERFPGIALIEFDKQ